MKTRSTTRCSRMVTRLWLFGLLLLATSLYNSVEVTPALAQARTVSTTARLPVAKAIFDTQTNEAVQFADAEAVFRVSFDPDGGSSVELTGHLRGNAKGRASDRVYEFMGGGQAKLNVSRPPASELILAYNGQLTVRGANSDQPILIILSVKINSGGAVTGAVRELRAQP